LAVQVPDEVPLAAMLDDAQDIDGAVMVPDLAVAVIGAEPLEVHRVSIYAILSESA
jgi:hypothetical protein